jgi:hypothetical protein
MPQEAPEISSKLEAINGTLGIIAVLMFLIAIVLGSPTHKDKDAVLAQCRLEAEKNYPTATLPLDPWAPADDYRDTGYYPRLMATNKAVAFIKLCLHADGYEWSWSHKKCQPTANMDENINPHCYRPTSWDGGLWFDFQAWLSNQEWAAL